MKKTVRICILCVLLGTLVTTGGVLYFRGRGEEKTELPETQNIETNELQKETEELLSSMELQTAFDYVMVEEEGYLVVYERDMETIFLETHIPLCRLSEELQEEITVGKKFETIEAVYDFLENYSS
ncbi:MAG: hypothetical protein ACI4ES_11105 [Roseburia sp.]